MSANTENSGRAGHLHRLFRDVLAAKRQVKTPGEAQLFLEAVCIQQPPAVCVEKIISKSAALDAVRTSVRVDLTPTFIQQYVLKLVAFLSDPSVKSLANGQFLQDILLAIIEPPTVWNAMVRLFLDHKLAEDNLPSFAWLVCEVVSMPPTADLDLIEDIKSIVRDGAIMQAQDHEVRELGYRIKRTLEAKSATGSSPAAYAPGGRHDNDFEDFRKISIYPTTDEFLSTDLPFYRKMNEVFDVDEASRAAVHLDNQSRLLREDMLAELRNDLHVAMGKKQNRGRRAMTLGQLQPVGVNHGNLDWPKPCTLAVACHQGLGALQGKSQSARKAYLKDHSSFLRHDAFGVLCKDKTIFGFAFVERDEGLLADAPPVVLLRFVDGVSLERALLALKTIQGVVFMLVDTPVFAYEPVLKGLKGITDLPLSNQLLQPGKSTGAFQPKAAVTLGLARLMTGLHLDGSLSLPNNSADVRLDKSQADSLLSALKNAVTLIQGPPGTGKSFIGALILLILVKAGLRVLVISYTNHALCQFLEDLHKTGIPWDSMVRLGSASKCTPQTAQILLSAIRNKPRLTMESRAILDSQKYNNFSPTWAAISEHLEFSEDDRQFYEALLVPSEDGGWRRAGRNRREIGPDYLFQQWRHGKDPGMFANAVHASHRPIWEMPPPAREGKIAKWMEALMEEHVKKVQGLVQELDDLQDRRTTIFDEGKVSTLKSKKIIGCTTTSAAKHVELLRNAEVDVIMVEEAAEILESHVLTALSASVQQLILIGDHKQLRPKVNNYALTVEKGEGFNLNMSLFERLIAQGAPHITLSKQHRMCPEISLFVRELTYPDLIDADKTKTRERVRGLRDRVVFFNHAKQEQTEKELADRRDPDVKASKRNEFEAEVVLSCVKYFIQQGYSSDKIVVLTPYLGQLRLLRDRLKDRAGVDPVLNDLDSSELIRAGLMTEAAAKVSQKQLRISTIDNYQGEESEIIIGSLTRSNESGDIGFMAAPERLNVLLSRARNCLVLVGNMATFMQSKRGQDTWIPFFELLKREGNLYDGLPVKCEQHPDTTALLKEPADFETFCPDGGCSKPCGEPLKCKTHTCKRRCHRIRDHSKVECTEPIELACTRQHKCRVPCSKQNLACSKCIQEDKEIERRAKRDLQMEKDRLARQAAYKKELQDIEDDLDLQRRILKYEVEKEEQKKTLEQRRAEVASLRETVERTKEQEEQRKRSEAGQSPTSPVTQPAGQTFPAYEAAAPGTARYEWEQSKRLEGARSKILDDLMAMIGLEDVKKQFLFVKSKVDAILRQNSSLNDERFSCSLLGNPGTGKTTVARLYGRFLNSVGVIPGSRFEETTGSRLANMGVTGCKKLLDGIQNNGGGVLFIDEAYQLSSASTPGGGAVLDFLLAEVENLVGKVVFILAGYQKQMESFFAHNPGFPSRFPREFKFTNYKDDELLQILKVKMGAKYKGRMKCEDGLDGLYTFIVARRIGYGRGSDGFGNARTVENTLARISDRQADRLRRERSQGVAPDDFLFTKEDLIGPEPSGALANCDAWTDLQQLTGLGSVKTAVRSLVGTLTENYRRELLKEPIVQYSLNRVFLGNPGTGKTTVAKLLGLILVHLGLLSRGEVVVKNPSDFVGAHIGHSEQQTKGILASTIGKVLVIEEAYGLYPIGNVASPDPFKTAVIDTIVAEGQSVPGSDQCVLLLGYKTQMENMFQNVNPGLARRFPIASAFIFEDFSDDELQQILKLKLKQQGFEATGQAKTVVKEMLNRARNRPNFGNAGEIDILLDAAKARHQTRLSKGETKCWKTLEAIDFDPDFDRAERTETNVKKLFEGTVGAEDVIAKLEGYQDTVRTMKLLELNPKESVPFNFLFRGPPGTGKTTTAKKIGKVFYDMGFLATTEVIECSASDLVGQYVGHTGPKVRQMLDKALGRVLFIDEAYRLCDGQFAKEAIDELVDAVTKDTYFKKLIVILAGYEKDINRLMSINSGLTSRFPEVINFRALTPAECFDLLVKVLQMQQKRLSEKGNKLDMSALEAPTDGFRDDVVEWFTKLGTQDGWGSARDVQTVAQGVFRKTTKGARKAVPIVVKECAVDAELKAMFSERQNRSKGLGSHASRTGFNMPLPTRYPPASSPPQASAPQASPPRASPQACPAQALATTVSTSTSMSSSSTTPAQTPSDSAPASPSPSRQSHPSTSQPQRDAGVSDQVWAQLQLDAAAEQAREDSCRSMLKAHNDAAEAARELVIKGLIATDEEERRKQEEERKRLEALREQLIKRMMEEEARRKKEAEARKKLAARGLCPVGYAWIRQAGGWRCAGGSHWVGDGQLEGM